MKGRRSRIMTIPVNNPWIEIVAVAWKYSRKLLRGMANEGM